VARERHRLARRSGAAPDSSEHHFIERAFACRTRPGGISAYSGSCIGVGSAQIRAVDYRFDFGRCYGAEWEFLIAHHRRTWCSPKVRGVGLCADGFHGR